MGRKFKLREKGNIFSGMTFYSYRKKKIPKDTSKSHYGYTFTTYLGERLEEGSVPFFWQFL